MDDLFTLATQACASKILLNQIKETMKVSRALENFTFYAQMMEQNNKMQAAFIAVLRSRMEDTASDTLKELETFRAAVKNSELPLEQKTSIEKSFAFLFDQGSGKVVVQ